MGYMTLFLFLLFRLSLWCYFGGLVQEGRNSIANTPELRLFGTYPSIRISIFFHVQQKML